MAHAAWRGGGSAMETRWTGARTGGMRRRIALAQAALLGGALAAACGAQPAGGVAAPSSKPAKVVIRTFASQAERDSMDQRVLPGYKQKAPQHTVEWEQQ